MSGRLAAFLAPRSIAIVGCPGDLTRPGARPLVYLQKHAYPGRIYPVNPRRAEIGGLRAYPTLASLPETPDLAWVGVPGSEVAPVLEEAGRLKIPHAVVLTAGFGETDDDGRERQGALRELAARAGVTVLGPNMLGFINCWDRVPLTYSPAGGLDRLIPGALGIASQSGALGGIVVNRAFDRMIGVSAMVSTGNEMDITVSECLEYFAEDPRTRAVALVAEGIRDGARFKAAAARLTEVGKPLVALKLGQSDPGRRNALTHTGALAGSHAAWRAVARQAGIVEVETFEDLVEVAGFLSRERRSPGQRVAVVTTSGGASIMTADQLAARGFSLPRLHPETVDALGRLLPAYALTRDNPVDVTAGLSEDLFHRVLVTLVEDPRVEAVVTTVTGARGVERAENVSRVALDAAKPVVPCWLGGSLTEDGLRALDARGVPCFRNPRTLALALAAARDFPEIRAGWRARRPIAPRRRAARGIPEGPLPYGALSALARRAGVPLAPEALVTTPEAAARAARGLGLPVALKIVAPGLPHKTEAGAVVLGLRTLAEVHRAGVRLLRRTRGARREGLLVQPMARGVEVLVGVTRDPTFGLLLVVGAGGIQAEILADTACRPLPVTRREIRAMLDETRLARVLRGVRGGPPADVSALVSAIAGVARLALLLGDRLASLDVNPIVVGARGAGALAVDLLAVFEPVRVVRSRGRAALPQARPPEASQ
ncbi:MAG: acetate--CoA ligase family protein [Candidatus Rokubacteria bacterium]|nr:acetate--CoA ligase family protein [Candidatus Rokubacteria bacterium]